jgi:hypothetical protein
MPTKTKPASDAGSEVRIAGKTYVLLGATENRRALPKGASCGNQLRALPKGSDCGKVTRARRRSPR